MIDDQLIQDASIAFASATSGVWPCPVAEVFDDATFVLFTVEVPASHNCTVVDASVRLAVTEALDGIIPVHPAQSFGSWIIAFTREGKLYECI